MDKIEKIRQEIERRHDYENEMYHKKNPDGRPNDGWAESLAIMGVLEELLTFLDTLSEESDKSLEEAAEEWAENEAYGKSDAEFEMAYGGFKAGAEWMTEQGETRVLSTESDYDSPGADYGGVSYLKYRIKDDTPIGTEFIVQIRKKED